jgi:hypothetical protein
MSTPWAGWEGTGQPLPFGDATLAKLAQQDARDRAEERRVQVEREARTERYQDRAMMMSVTKARLAGDTRSVPELLGPEGGVSVGEVLEQARVAAERGDRVMAHQAWKRGEAVEPPEVIPPEPAVLNHGPRWKRKIRSWLAANPGPPKRYPLR